MSVVNSPGLTTPLHCVVISKIPFVSPRGPKGSSNSHLLRVKERCVMEYPFSFCSWELCGQAVRAVVFRISVTGHITDSSHFCFVHCDNPYPWSTQSPGLLPQPFWEHSENFSYSSGCLSVD